ncbi:MAG: PH domain-containing protein, partial [Pseudonocardiaceae bacterium]
MLGPRDPDDYLLPTERRVIRVRLHWASLVPLLLQTVAILVGAVILSGLFEGGGDSAWLVQSLLWYTAFGAVLYFAYKVLEWWVERIVVTDKRFMITSGIIET